MGLLLIGMLFTGGLFLAGVMPKPAVGYQHGEPFVVLLLPVGGGRYLSTPAAVNFKRMEAKAASEGIPIPLNSAFREQGKQARLYQKRVRSLREGKQPGEDGYQPPTARPGFSNHQRGLSVDVNRWKDKRTLPWLRANAATYGFVNDVKGEPWHWTYVGVN